MNMSVCLSVFVCACVFCPRAYLTNFTKFSLHVACVRGSVLLRRCCITSGTSGFVDDVMFTNMAQAPQAVV